MTTLHTECTCCEYAAKEIAKLQALVSEAREIITIMQPSCLSGCISAEPSGNGLNAYNHPVLVRARAFLERTGNIMCQADLVQTGAPSSSPSAPLHSGCGEDAEQDDEIALMGASLRCCDVYKCHKPAIVTETDTDGARIFMCEDHKE